MATLLRTHPVESIHNPTWPIRYGEIGISNFHPSLGPCLALLCHVVKMCQWWSDDIDSLIFSSLLRISKKEGLRFMSAAQHSSVNLKSQTQGRNQHPKIQAHLTCVISKKTVRRMRLILDRYLPPCVKYGANTEVLVRE